MESPSFPAGDPFSATSSAQHLARQLAWSLCSRVTLTPSSVSAIPGAQYARMNAIPLSAEQGARFAAKIESGILDHLDSESGPALVAYQGLPTPILKAAIEAADALSHRLDQGVLPMWSYQVFADRVMARPHNPAFDSSWETMWPRHRDPESKFARQAAAYQAWDAAWRWSQTIIGWHQASRQPLWSPITDDQVDAAMLVLAVSIRHVAAQQQYSPTDPVDEARVSLAHLPVDSVEALKVMAAPVAAIVAGLDDPDAAEGVLAAGSPPEMRARNRFEQFQAWPPPERHRVISLAHRAVADLHAAHSPDVTLVSTCDLLLTWTTTR